MVVGFRFGRNPSEYRAVSCAVRRGAGVTAARNCPSGGLCALFSGRWLRNRAKFPLFSSARVVQSRQNANKFAFALGFSYLCAAYEQRIELWCNGNTADFGSVVLGSSPGSSTYSTLNISVLFCFVRRRASALPEVRPRRVGISERWSVAVAGLYERPGERCLQCATLPRTSVRPVPQWGRSR